jgi:hypothetical protein
VGCEWLKTACREDLFACLLSEKVSKLSGLGYSAWSLPSPLHTQTSTRTHTLLLSILVKALHLHAAHGDEGAGSRADAQLGAMIEDMARNPAPLAGAAFATTSDLVRAHFNEWSWLAGSYLEVLVRFMCMCGWFCLLRGVFVSERMSWGWGGSPSEVNATSE